MILKIDFSRDAAKFYFNLQPKQFKQIAIALHDLTRDPEPNDSLAMKGFPGFRRKDAGEFRVVYRVVNDTLMIDVIDKRNDDKMYGVFKRKEM